MTDRHLRHSISISDTLWAIGKEISGLRNPASWIREGVSEWVYEQQRKHLNKQAPAPSAAVITHTTPLVQTSSSPYAEAILIDQGSLKGGAHVDCFDLLRANPTVEISDSGQILYAKRLDRCRYLKCTRPDRLIKEGEPIVWFSLG